MMKRYQGCIGRIVGVIFFIVITVGCSPSQKLTIERVPLKTRTQSPPTSTVTEISSTQAHTQVHTKGPTITPTSKVTETTIPTITTTPTSTPTSTIEPAVLSLNQDTVCLDGASFDHNVDEYVLSESEYPIYGQLSDQSWWLVGVDEEQSCWIYGEYSTVRGEIVTLPIITPPSLPTLTPTELPSTAGIYYILISMGTGGYGCGDSLIYWYPGVWVKGDMEADITAALNALFSNHNQYTNGLYNPMYQSQLKAKSVEVVGNEVVVKLAGTLVRPKDSCESQRMHDQIWYTVSQFSPTRAVIYLNNALLGDLLVVSKK
jgi:hypothetical protein